MKTLNDLKPNFIVAAFDTKGKNFRHEIYPKYKANRPAAPDDLKEQLPLTRLVVESFGIANIEMQGFEADDIIASLCRKYSKTHDIVILSPDKDLMQLIDDNVCMYDPSKSRYIRSEDVVNKFGVHPSNIRKD